MLRQHWHRIRSQVAADADKQSTDISRQRLQYWTSARTYRLRYWTRPRPLRRHRHLWSFVHADRFVGALLRPRTRSEKTVRPRRSPIGQRTFGRIRRRRARRIETPIFSYRVRRRSTVPNRSACMHKAPKCRRRCSGYWRVRALVQYCSRWREISLLVRVCGGYSTVRRRTGAADATSLLPCRSTAMIPGWGQATADGKEL